MLRYSCGLSLSQGCKCICLQAGLTLIKIAYIQHIRSCNQITTSNMFTFIYSGLATLMYCSRKGLNTRNASRLLGSKLLKQKETSKQRKLGLLQPAGQQRGRHAVTLRNTQKNDGSHHQFNRLGLCLKNSYSVVIL